MKVIIKLNYLSDPLIALGLVENREEVEQIVLEVDDDGTGKIEFEEFLDIIRNGNSTAKGASEKTIKIYQFFKSLTTGKFSKKDKELIFTLFISRYRRK